jgi:eukaryotic-like serine/threonine-protein kinase
MARLIDERSYGPGTVLLDRYRIVSRIGGGGMGEVYLADDLVLGQPVALKFLPEALVQRDDVRRRFYEEVRTARRVTHANVARVHDIAEVEGRPVLSMEYVEGEDLAQLLRQIGRLPREKALDIARQVCAGLAAAHEAGVLHRDLKPANVLLDRSGKVRLTDFGLAVVLDEQGEGGLVGTPAYMSPEQIAGGRVDERSEVYSLGLLLYELFTGRRAFQGRTFEELHAQQLQETPATPSSVLAEMDPAVERVILRCLEKDPEERPASVRSVAWALPGGDPLAAALAAGETPPPELVAEAGDRGGLAPGVALALFAAVLVGLATVVALAPRTGLVPLAGLEEPPAVLARRARDVLQRAGADAEHADVTSGFMPLTATIEHVAEEDPDPRRWDRLAEKGQKPFAFWYRTGPTALVPFNVTRLWPSYNDPPQATPGMARVRLDPDGGLLSFSIVPGRYDEGADPRPDPDWAPLFAEAGLDLASFEPVDPRWTPEVASDRRFAWQGAYPGAADLALRVEAASFRGRPVSFELLFPWDKPPEPPHSAVTTAALINVAWIVVAMVGGGLLARRNLRLGRGDSKGALRLGVAALVLRLAAWLCAAHHLPLTNEINSFLVQLAMGLLLLALLWTFYLALEPYFRRLWPRRLVSWVRLVDGRLRDPLVGRDVLVGLLFGLAATLLATAYAVVPAWLGLPPPRPDQLGGDFTQGLVLSGSRQSVALLLLVLYNGLTSGLFLAILLLLLRLVLRRQSLAVLGMIAVGAFLTSLDTGWPWADRAFGAAVMALWLWAMLRFGLLPVTIGVFVHVLLSAFPLTTDTSAWYFGASALALGTTLVLAAYGFTVARAGRPLFGDPFLEQAGASA